MENIQYNIQFEKLCSLLNIGQLISEPKPITGGLLHRMYAIETSLGKYAIKALNPQVMQRSMAKSNILNGERIASYVENFIPAIAAKQFHNIELPQVEGQYYLVYDWIEGVSLYGEDIYPYHCEQIGNILGKIHSIDFSSLNIPKPDVVSEEIVDWKKYLNQGQRAKLSWVEVVKSNIDRLYVWNKRYLISMKYLEAPLVIGHGDIDPKNVMWQNNKPVIIDWESAGYLNPAHEFIVYLLCWSDKNGQIDRLKFKSFIKGYLEVRQIEKMDWSIVMDAVFSPHWLEYSFKRSLGLESADEAEQKMGTEQIVGVINYFNQYEKLMKQVLKWINIDILKVNDN